MYILALFFPQLFYIHRFTPKSPIPPLTTSLFFVFESSSSGWSGTFYVNLADLELVAVCLSQPLEWKN